MRNTSSRLKILIFFFKSVSKIDIGLTVTLLYHYYNPLGGNLSSNVKGMPTLLMEKIIKILLGWPSEDYFLMGRNHWITTATLILFTLCFSYRLLLSSPCQPRRIFLLSGWINSPFLNFPRHIVEPRRFFKSP